MGRKQILVDAATLIDGDRAKDYGDAATSFSRVACIWSGILGMDVTPEQVAMCLAGLKLSRLAHSPNHRDSWVDICGYAALGGEIAGRAARSINEGETES